MFYEQLKKICVDNGTTVTALLKKLGISTSNGTYWKNGSIPSSDMVLNIANYFDVSIDYLLGLTDKKEKPSVIIDGELVTDPMDAEIMNLISYLSPEQKKMVLAQMKGLKDNQ